MAKTIKKAPVKKVASAPRAVKVKPPTMLELVIRIAVALETIAANTTAVNLTEIKETPVVHITSAGSASTASASTDTSPTTLTMIREQINAKVGEGKEAKVVALLKKYDATAGSNLAEEHYTNFYNEIKTL